MILDELPEDVRKDVVWEENYWLTDEAISVYLRSAGVFGREQHSPFLCSAHGIPVVRSLIFSILRVQGNERLFLP